MKTHRFSILFVILAIALTSQSAMAQEFGSGQTRFSTTTVHTATGVVLGGVAGAVIGHNSGSHNAGKGAVIGAVGGGIIGALSGQHAELVRERKRHRPSVVSYGQPTYNDYSQTTKTIYTQQSSSGDLIAAARAELAAAQNQLAWAEQAAQNAQQNLDLARVKAASAAQTLRSLGGN